MALVAGLAAALLAGCGSSGPSGPVTEVAQRTIESVGPILTTASGITLYMFPKDAERHVSCTGRCAGDWPPLTVPAGGHPKAGSGVQQALLGTDPNPAGGPPVVTYDGWPLYRFAGDHTAGQTNGQGLDSDGGYWWAIAPDGQPLTVAISAN